MKYLMKSLCVIFAATFALAGCNMWSVDAYWRSGKYMLVAIDSPGQMSLTVDQGGGTGFGIVGSTVFAIGSDTKFIVLKQHPGDNFGNFDRSITNYFIVKRNSTPASMADESSVQGPLTKAQFDKLSKQLSLPAFSKTFKDLK